MEKRHFMYVLEPLSFETPDDMSDAQKRIAGAHFDYLKKLTGEGKVVLAGRTEGAEMGITVLETDDETSARTIMDNDPAVKHGLMRATFYPYRLALLRGAAPAEG